MRLKYWFQVSGFVGKQVSTFITFMSNMCFDMRKRETGAQVTFEADEVIDLRQDRVETMKLDS